MYGFDLHFNAEPGKCKETCLNFVVAECCWVESDSQLVLYQILVAGGCELERTLDETSSYLLVVKQPCQPLSPPTGAVLAKNQACSGATIDFTVLYAMDLDASAVHADKPRRVLLQLLQNLDSKKMEMCERRWVLHGFWLGKTRIIYTYIYIWFYDCIL